MYDQPRIRETVHFEQIDFGAGSNTTRVLAVPVRPEQAPAAGGIVTSGQPAGRVVGARIHNVTEDFAGATSDAGVQVGDGTDADKYFDSGLVLDETVDTGESVFLADDGSAVDIESERDTITVTFVAAVGTPTGIADVDLILEWF